jgi:enterochelin esterase family protein
VSIVPLNTLAPKESQAIGSIAWWAEIESNGTPAVMEKIDCKDSVDLVFFWRDPQGNELTSPIQAVYIDVNCITEHHSSSPTGLTRILGTDVWRWQMTIERDWCGSYSFIPLVKADLPEPFLCKLQQRRWWLSISARKIADPFNQQGPKFGSWRQAHSAINLEAPRQLAWASLDRLSEEVSFEHGTKPLRRFDWQSQHLGTERHIWVFETRDETRAETLASSHDMPREDPHDRPLVILLDGEVWSTSLPISHALVLATNKGSLQACVYLFIDSLGSDTRGWELTCNPDFWLAVQRELLPKVQRLAPFSTKNIIIAGQSYGGLSALYAALSWPEIFTNVLSLSGSFWWPNVEAFRRLNTGVSPFEGTADTNENNDEVSGMLGAIQGVLESGHAQVPLNLYLEAGSKERGIRHVNQQLYRHLTHLGYSVTYRVYNGGHDKLCWRSGLLDGLKHFIGTENPNSVNSILNSSFI